VLQRIALYATLGYVLDLTELGWTTTGFWCILALFMANTWMTRRETLEEIQEEVRRVRAQHQKDNNND